MPEETPPPLPLDEPTTLAGVKAWLRIDDTTDDVPLTGIVGAVNFVVRGLPIADRARGLGDWPANITLGALLMSARLYARKDSPQGVAVFASEGPVYVQRNDPDVAMLLQLGDWSRPAVG